MKPLLSLLLLVASLVVNSHAAEILFQDDFKGKLGEGWSWVREDPAAWRVGDRGLEIRLQPGNMWGPPNNARNVLVRSVPDPAATPVEVGVSIENKPTEQYEQVDLVWYYDDSNMVKIGQELVDKKLSIVMGREQKDRTRTIAIIPLKTDSVRVRFIVQGDKLRGEFRPADSQSWQVAGECDLPVNGQPKVSLQCYQGPARVERWARLTEFRIQKSDKP
jgi:regulation of enolase protein 1 (concanavalin A-like superfamily)